MDKSTQMSYPKRSESHKIDEKAITLIRGMLVNDWIVRSQDGRDYGIDLQMERFDDERPTGDFIFVQVKGTNSPFSEKVTLRDFPVKTINYALMFSVPFFVFYVSVDSKKAKFIWLQKYALSHLNINNPKWRIQNTLTIEFPDENDLESNLSKLITISSQEKIIGLAYRYLFLFERISQFNLKLIEGDKKAARVCKNAFYELYITGCLSEFVGELFILFDGKTMKDKVKDLLLIYEKAENGIELTEAEIKEVKEREAVMKIGKVEALNLESIEKLNRYLHGVLPY
ncbi:MAG: DUF4365 domain-containing protein [Candidatus Saccharibacteria bacterium]|nr:DUF4365 domain-containing protein [Candidatus Saccharibacteria bacterium]